MTLFPGEKQRPSSEAETRPQPILPLVGPSSSLKEPLWLMPLLDVVLSLVAFMLAYYARYDLQLIRRVLEYNDVPFSIYVPYMGLYSVWLLLSYATARLYRRPVSQSIFAESAIVANGVTNAVVLLMAVSFAVQATAFSRLMLVYLAVISIVLLVGVRLTRRGLYAYLRTRRGIGVRRTLIIGAGDVGQSVLRVMLARRGLGYLPVGYLDDDPLVGKVDLGRVRGLGGLDQLGEVLDSSRVDLVVVTLPWTEHNRIMNIVEICRRQGIAVRVVPDVFQLNLRHVHMENLEGIPLLGLDAERSFYTTNRILKRVLDLTLISLASPLLLLIFGIMALLIKLDGSGGPVFYAQVRVGEDGKKFNMYKFRSMIPNADRYRQELVKQQNQDPRHPKIVDDPRITRIGRFIRRTSIDELPNLINVLLGQMSLVGPRPPTPDEVELYDNWHMQRLNTVPGITGLWQVSGRSHVPFDEMVLLDIYYIENWAIRLDLEILLRTIPRVLLREGAY